MTKSLITFPAVKHQMCYNCNIKLGIEAFYHNLVEMTQDAYGMPVVIVRCPVCKTLIEWETINN